MSRYIYIYIYIAMLSYIILKVRIPFKPEDLEQGLPFLCISAAILILRVDSRYLAQLYMLPDLIGVLIIVESVRI